MDDMCMSRMKKENNLYVLLLLLAVLFHDVIEKVGNLYALCALYK
jgi:hypothetical protein